LIARTAGSLFCLRIQNSYSKNKVTIKLVILVITLVTIPRQNEWPSLDSKKLASLLNEIKYPSPTQQAINLISWLGKNIPAPGVMYGITPRTH
jgi:hypothetical protein